MATQSVQLVQGATSDAEFRAHCQTIHNILAAGGWIQTADTGQIDLATVAKPGVANTVAGYEIWRSNDASGSLQEIYLKIEYGTGGFSTNNSVYITIGWASNGSGTLTGVTSTRTQIGCLTNVAGNAGINLWNNLSAGAGWVCFAMNTGSTTGYALSIERLYDENYNLTNNILFNGYLYVNSQHGQKSQGITPTLAYVLYDTGTGGGTIYNMLQACIIQANAIQSGEGGVSLQFGQMGGLSSPSANCFGGSTSVFGAAQTNDIKITTYGVERNYIMNAGFPYFNNVSANPSNLMMRFE